MEWSLLIGQSNELCAFDWLKFNCANVNAVYADVSCIMTIISSLVSRRDALKLDSIKFETLIQTQFCDVYRSVEELTKGFPAFERRQYLSSKAL